MILKSQFSQVFSQAYERQIQHFNYMTEIAKKLELSLAEKEEERNQLAEKLNSATFQQAENIKAVIEVNCFVKDIRGFS